MKDIHIDRIVRSKRRTVSIEITREAQLIVRASLRTPSKEIDHVSMPSAPTGPASMVPPLETEPLFKRVCERLGTEPLLVDELIRQCHANSAEMQHTLLELELEGRIERHPGNRVSLATL